MKILKKIFGIPKPRALPMEKFCNPGDYTWKDWHEDARKNYPIRYFLSETVPMWYRVHIYMNVSHFWYWIKYRLYKKSHLLDLRQPHTNTGDDYRWGRLDEYSQMLYACFNILMNYIKSSRNGYVYSIDDIEYLQKQILNTENEYERHHLEQDLEFFKEVRYLHYYWTVARKRQLKDRDEILSEWSDSLETRHTDPEYTKLLWDKLRKIEEETIVKEEEALIRLVKIREKLWV